VSALSDGSAGAEACDTETGALATYHICSLEEAHAIYTSADDVSTRPKDFQKLNDVLFASTLDCLG